MRRTLSDQQRASIIRKYLRTGFFRGVKGVSRGTIYTIKDDHPGIYEAEKDNYRIEVALQELGLGPGASPPLAVLQPFLKLSGIPSALALYLVHRNKLYKPVTFAKFCRENFAAKSRDAGYRRITYAEVYLDLLGTALARKDQMAQKVVRGLRDAHVREFVEVKSDKKRYNLLLAVVKRTGRPTARAIAEAVRKRDPGPPAKPEPESVRLRAALLGVQAEVRRILESLETDTSIRADLESLDGRITKALRLQQQ